MLSTYEEDVMPIRNEDWVAIDKRISAAVDQLHPHGWRKALHLAKEFGSVTAVVALIAGLLAIIVTLTIGVTNRREADATFKGATEQRLKSIEGKLTSLQALLSSSQPSKRGNQEAAKMALADARNRSIPISSGILAQAGQNFIEAATDSPTAWGVATDFLDYKSAQNAPFMPQPINLFKAKKEATQYNYPRFPGLTKANNEVSVMGAAPMETSARLELIDSPEKQPAGFGDQFVLVRGGDMIIDGLRMRHVVLLNVNVHYSGKPLIAEDVTFIDCHFVIDNDKNGRSLGNAILSSTKVNLSLAS